MKVLKLIPVFLSFLMLGAHFIREGFYILTGVCILILFLLIIRKKWVVRLFQICLILGAIEWIRIMVIYVTQRLEFGMPWIRLAIILISVSLFTGLSALIFQSSDLKKHYHLSE